jgi:hypothetical protein
MIVALVIFSHDFSAHDHLEFLHNLLSDDASIKQITSLFALNGIMEQAVVSSGTIMILMKNACQWMHDKQGNEYNWPTLEILTLIVNTERDSLCHPVSSGLSPPTNSVARAGGFYPISTCVVLSSDHVIQNNWFHHVSSIFSSSIATGYFNIRNTEKDRSFLHVSNWPLARFNNAPEMLKPQKAHNALK